MSQDTISVQLDDRKTLRKGLNQLRSGGMVPAVIHDHGKDSIHVMGDVLKIYKAYLAAGKHHPVELSVGTTKHLALIKDVDFDPRKHEMRHVVFQAIKQNEKVEAEIPVILDGDIPAEIAGHLVIKQLDHVEVEALPAKLPDEFKLDASVLKEVGDRIHVSDIPAEEGVTIMTDPELTIAVVEEPRVEAEPEPEAEVDAASVESEHGGDTPQDTQEAEDKPGGQKQNQPKGE